MPQLDVRQEYIKPVQAQYSWGITIVLLTLLGTVAAFLAALRSETQNSQSTKIQSGTTAAIFLVLIHNIYWEHEVVEGAARGWTLLSTLPPFLVCFILSIALTVVFTISARRRRTNRTDSNK